MNDFWDSAKSILGRVAPMLATAVGGPFAGVATTAIIGALGLAPDTTQEQAATAVLGASADQMIQLKKADQDFEEKMKQLGIDADRLGNEDRASARNREIQEPKDRTPSVLAYTTLIGYFAAVGAVLTGHVPFDGPAGAMVGAVFGYVAGDAKAIYNYYFGTSSGSEAKTAMIYNSTPGAPSRPLVP